MTKEQVLEFIKWLSTKEMCLAGYTIGDGRGIYGLAELRKEDYEAVAVDFINSRLTEREP